MLSSELKGKPIGVTVNRKNIVLWRNSGNEIIALKDRCPHRGYRLSKGTLCKSGIRCEYHGMVFNSLGQVAKSPPWDSLQEYNKIMVGKFRCFERSGLIWIMTDECLDGGMSSSVPDLGDPTYLIRKKVGCHVNVILENMFDVTHFSAVHNNSFSSSMPISYEAVEFERTKSSFKMTYSIAISASDGFKQFVGAGVSKADIIATYLPPYAQVFEVRYNNGFSYKSIQAALPVDEENTNYFQVGFLGDDINPERKEYFHASDMKILEEDLAVMENVTGDPLSVISSEGRNMNLVSNKHLYEILRILDPQKNISS